MRPEEWTSKEAADAWAELEKKKPLIFHVTNAVATPLQANVCLAVGASPIMSQYPEETAELMTLSQGFLVNLGTPTSAAVEAVERGMEALQGKNRVTLLDPVGYGASRFRTNNADGLLARYKFSILKGNVGEISLLAKVGGSTKGVDTLSGGDVRRGVLELARKHGCVACATGEVDVFSDGEKVFNVRGGSRYLPLLSGSGCAAGTLVLSAAAACGDPLLGTLCGLLAMGMASERAERKCTGSGSFAPLLIDELYRLSAEDFTDSRPRWSVA